MQKQSRISKVLVLGYLLFGGMAYAASEKEKPLMMELGTDVERKIVLNGKGGYIKVGKDVEISYDYASFNKLQIGRHSAENIKGELENGFFVSGLENIVWDKENMVLDRAATEGQLSFLDDKLADLKKSFEKWKEKKDSYLAVDGEGNQSLLDGKGLHIQNQAGEDLVTLTKDGLDNGGKKISNLGAGVLDTDAVNLGQLKELREEHASRIHENAMRIEDTRKDLKYGLASSAAMASLDFPELQMGEMALAAAMGTYKGSQALALGVQGAATEDLRLNANLAFSPSESSDYMAGLGFSWKFLKK